MPPSDLIWGAITEEKKLDLKTSEFYVILTCFSPTPGGSDDKASDYNAGDPRSIPGSPRRSKHTDVLMVAHGHIEGAHHTEGAYRSR